MQSGDRHQLRLAAPAIKASQRPVKIASSHEKILQSSPELDLHRFLPSEQVGHCLRFIQRRKKTLEGPSRKQMELVQNFKNLRGFCENWKDLLLFEFASLPWSGDWRRKKRGDLEGEGRNLTGRHYRCMDPVYTVAG